MKKNPISLIIVLFIATTMSVYAENKTEKINVNGKCEMCKTRIETAAKSLNGVRSALWDQETKNLKVTYDDKKTSTQQIQTSIAMIGHDTQLFSANDKKYAELPGCCNYNRDNNRKKMTHGGNLNECDHDINASKGSCCETK